MSIIEKKHKTHLKDFTVKRSFCGDKTCDFYGKMAEQGVCFSIIPDRWAKHYTARMKAAERMLDFNRKHNYKKLSQKQIMKSMESEIVCTWMNYTSCLDELVWLRGENAKLRGKLGLFQKNPK